MADQRITQSDAVAKKLMELSPERMRTLMRRVSGNKTGARAESIIHIPNCDSFPLSYAQEGFWFLEQLIPRNPALSWRYGFRIRHPLDVDSVRQSFKEIGARHDILRTRYITQRGVPMQVIEREMEAPTEISDLSALPGEELEGTLRKLSEGAGLGFDVEKGPLWRVRIVKVSDADWVILGAIHHSISDAWSQKIFLRDLLTFIFAGTGHPNYRALPKLSVQYGDFAKWQREKLRGAALKDLVEWWKSSLLGIGDHHLPIDRPRPPVQRFRQAAESLVIPESLAAAVRELSRRAGVTPFMTYCAAFKVLLMRHSGKTDVAVIIPVASRDRVEVEELIGLFVNTVVVRTDLAGRLSFTELLSRVRDSVLGAFAHRGLPFEVLVRELRIKRELDRNPLCQVAFQFEDIPVSGTDTQWLDRSTLEVLPVDTGASVYDLNLHLFGGVDSVLMERPDGVRAVMFYDPDLFDSQTVRRMLDHYLVLLRSVIASPQSAITGLPLIGDVERRRQLAECNTRREWPDEDVIHSLIERQSAFAPNEIAAVYGTQTISRRDLNQRANQLARYLHDCSIGRDTPVAIGTEGFDSLVGTLGILRAGGCFVPLNMGDSGQRWKETLEDTRSAIVITNDTKGDHLRNYEGRIVLIDRQWNEVAKYSTAPLGRTSIADDLAYILCTWRGGILVEHRTISRRIQWFQEHHAVKEGDGVLQWSSLSSDGGIWERLWPLAHGARLVMADETVLADVTALPDLISKWDIRVAHLPASVLVKLQGIARTGASITTPLQIIFCTGEAPPHMTLQAVANLFRCSVCHLYAPAEAAMEVAATYCKPATDTSPTSLMRRTDSVSVYVLDESLQPAPVGVTGELYVASEALARGRFERGSQPKLLGASPFRSGERFLPTGDLARMRSDGAVELVEGSRRCAWIDDHIVEPLAIAAALLEEPSVDDCVVMVRQRLDGTNKLVAYVVTDSVWRPDRLDAHLRYHLPAWMLPSQYVRVGRIPLSPSGNVCTDELERVELVDETVRHLWQDRLASVRDTWQAAVILREEVDKPAYLNLEELLTGAKDSLQDPPPRTSALPIGHKFDEIPDDEASGVGEFRKTPLDRVAIAEGGPLPNCSVRILPDVLERAAASMHGVRYVRSGEPDRVISYVQLLEDARRIAGGLKRSGLEAGSKVIFQFGRNEDFICAFWGCMLCGIVPVPIALAPTYKTTNAGTEKIRLAWKLLNHPPILSDRQLAPLIAESATLVGEDSYEVRTIEELRDAVPDEHAHAADPNDVALLLLTSGSAGESKGVQLSHLNLVNMCAAVAAMNGFVPSDVSLNWMPLDHVGGIVMFHVRDVYIGCDQIQADTYPVLQDPLLWLEWIDKYRATITWAPNFAFGLINEQAKRLETRQLNLSCMRFILNGGETIVARTARRFLILLGRFGLPQTAMHPAWGMSETSSGIVFSDSFSLDSTRDDCSHVEVGRPVAGITVRIVDERDRLLGEGAIGRLQVRGTTVTCGYYERPDLNREVFHDGAWFDTGDLASMSDGKLTITGRRKDIIIINGVNHSCHEIEATVEEISEVETSYTAAFAAREPDSNTDELVILFCPHCTDDTALRGIIQRIRARVVQKTGVAPDYVIPVDKESIPKTSIGKVQRSKLRERFEAGDYRPILRRLEQMSECDNTLPDWFHRKTWIRRELDESHSPADGTWLVLADNMLGESLCAALTREGRAWVSVEPGRQFAKLSDTHYCIDPGESDHYSRVIQEAQQDHGAISQIVHLWTYLPYEGEIADPTVLEERLKRGACSVLSLTQALGIQVKHPVHVTVVSSCAQAVPGCKCIAPERAAMLGLVRTVAKELPQLRCRHVNLSLDEPDDINVKRIFSETGVAPREPEIAYAGGERLVPRLERVNFDVGGRQALPFVEGGGYVLVGGLGGIGAEVAKYLLLQHKARLLIIGRTALPDRSSWKDVERDEKTMRRIQAYEELEKLGDVSYQGIDVCDGARLGRAVEAAERRWGRPLSGVVYSAGIFYERLLREETLNSFEEVVARKLYGAAMLHRIVKDRPGAWCIFFSSVNAFFGGVGVGAYSACNSALEAYSQFQHMTCNSIKTCCISWSMWNGVGMSRQYVGNRVSRARGFSGIAASQGISSLLLALQYDLNQVMVGLDGRNPSIRRYLTTGAAQVEHLYGYFCANGNADLWDRLNRIEVRDCVGARTVCKFISLDQMPLTEQGAIDYARLGQLDVETADLKRQQVGPRTSDEREIALIWQGVLGVESVGIYDDFFAAGGNSMLAVQLMDGIRRRFHRELPLSTLFEGATVAHLAAALGEGEGAEHVSALVAIKPAGSNPPLFLVHPAGGNVLCYHGLAHVLGADQPVYGLQEPGLRQDHVAYLTIEEMALRYRRALQEIQPEGPYLIGGWSMGGIVAFEMARQIAELGQEVGLLAILDVEAPGALRAATSAKDSAQALLALCRMLEIYAATELGVSEDDLAGLSEDAQIDCVFGRIQERGLLPADIDSTYFRRYLQVHENNVRAMWCYEPRPYSGRITLLRSEERLTGLDVGIQNFDDRVLGWQAHSREPVAVHVVPGNHITMMGSDNVTRVATILRTSIADIRSNRIGASS